MTEVPSLSFLLGEEVVGGCGGCWVLGVAEPYLVGYRGARHCLCLGGGGGGGVSEGMREQEIRLNSKPWFNITNLSLCPPGNQPSTHTAALWGSRGALVVSFTSAGGGGTGPLKEFLIAESCYLQHPALNVSQLRWASALGHNLLLILNSDSYLRIYDGETGEAVSVFNVGGADSLPLATHFAPEVSPSTAIDFDLGPFLSPTNTQTLFFLRPTGQVHLGLLNVMGNSARIASCLMNSMYEIPFHESVRHEGSYANILCSNEFPVLAILRQDDGTLAHAVMAPVKSSEAAHLDDVDLLASSDSYRFFIVERLRFPGSLLDEGGMPVLIDPLFPNRYVHISPSGVVAVTIKFLPEVRAFLQSPEEASLSVTGSEMELLIQLSPSEPVVAVTFTSTYPQKLIVVLKQEMKTLLFTLPSLVDSSLLDRLSRLSVLESSESGSSRDPSGPSVLASVQKLLKAQPTSQAYLSVNEDTPKNRTILFSAIQSKLTQMNNLEKGCDYLISYIASMNQKREEIGATLQTLLAARQELKDAAQGISELYEELKEKDEAIGSRLDQILAAFHQTFPVLTDKEKDWQVKLERMRDKELELLKTKAGGLKEQSKAFTGDEGEREEGRDLKGDFRGQEIEKQFDTVKREVEIQQRYIRSLTSSVSELHDLFFRRLVQ